MHDMCLAEQKPSSEARWKLDMMACAAAALLALLLSYLASSEGNATTTVCSVQKQPDAIPKLAGWYCDVQADLDIYFQISFSVWW